MSDADIVRQAIGVDLLEVDAGEALAALARMETDLDWYGFHLDKYEKDYEELANERDRLRALLVRARDLVADCCDCINLALESKRQDTLADEIDDALQNSPLTD